MLPQNRILPCLLAGAAGDCIGGPYEGLGKVFNIASLNKPWETSDDTLLTLATCRAIVHAQSVDPAAIAAEFVKAFNSRQLRRLGASTFKALQELAAGKHWSLTGASGDYAAGNGAAMRIAPLAFFLNPWQESDRTKIRDVCRITHRHDEAYIGALAIIYAMHMLCDPGLATFGTPQKFVDKLASYLPDTAVRDSLFKLAALPASANHFDAAQAAGNSGYVAHSVPLAIFLAALYHSDLAQALPMAVKCGGDTDTIAAIVGYILGAQDVKLPQEWIDKIPGLTNITALADQMARING